MFDDDLLEDWELPGYTERLLAKSDAQSAEKSQRISIVLANRAKDYATSTVTARRKQRDIERERRNRLDRIWKGLLMEAAETAAAETGLSPVEITIPPEVLAHPNCGVRVSKKGKHGLFSFVKSGKVPEECRNLGAVKNKMLQRLFAALLAKNKTVTISESVRINAAVTAYINGLLVNRRLVKDWGALTPDQANAMLNGEQKLAEKFADSIDELGLDSVQTVGIQEILAGIHAERQPVINVNVVQQSGEPSKQTVSASATSGFLPLPEDG